MNIFVYKFLLINYFLRIDLRNYLVKEGKFFKKRVWYVIRLFFKNLESVYIFIRSVLRMYNLLITKI